MDSFCRVKLLLFFVEAFDFFPSLKYYVPLHLFPSSRCAENTCSFLYENLTDSKCDAIHACTVPRVQVMILNITDVHVWSFPTSLICRQLDSSLAPQISLSILYIAHVYISPPPQKKQQHFCTSSTAQGFFLVYNLQILLVRHALLAINYFTKLHF